MIRDDLIESHFAPHHCIRRIRDIVNKPKISRAELTYAALEVRYAIESTFLIYLEILREGGLTPKDCKIYQPKLFFKEIMAAEPDFEKKMQFIRCYLSVGEREVLPVVPDCHQLRCYHGICGNFLHATGSKLLESRDKGFWEELYKSVMGALVYLEGVIAGGFPKITMTDLGMDCFRRYVDGKISEDEVKEELAKGGIKRTQ